jgi:SPP1 gp7 family putative phage head morphogenesis protein
MTANDEIRDRAIAHQIYLLRYESGVTRKILKVLSQADKDLISQLSDLESTMSIAEIDTRLEGIRNIISASWDYASLDLENELAALAEYEANHQEQVIRDSTPVELNIVSPSAETLIAAVESKPFEGKILKEWIDKLDEDSYIRIRDAVRMGIVEGESYGQITKRVIGTKALNYSDGVTALNMRQAQALVSTAVAHTANEARQTFYGANDDLIKGVQWVSTLDARTTPICQSRDGTVYPVDSGPRPPAHFRCRSSTTPVLKSWKELGIDMEEAPAGTRASMDGQVPEAETYQTWLKKKSAAFQDDVLGPTRGKLFREGMPLDRFVDQSGKEYTLKQLRSKDSTMFRKAGID